MGFRDSIPAGLQEILQNGLLYHAFEDPLVATFLYDRGAKNQPWPGSVGSQGIMTRSGLMSPVPTPVTCSDASANTYGFEQYSVFMDQWGNSKDTNMAVSAMALASELLNYNRILGINAAETLDLVARAALYSHYGAGFSWATETTSASTSLTVADGTGFQYNPQAVSTSGSNPGEGNAAPVVNQLAPVSGSNPLPVTINGVANTVTGVTFTGQAPGPGVMLAPATLTLGSAATVTNGQAVLSSIAPVSFRPNARATANQLVAGDIATLSLFQSAVTRLRRQKVPTIGGAYTAFISPQTIDELWQDSAFQLAYRGRADSPAYRDFSVEGPIGQDGTFYGRFAGIDWIVTTNGPSDDSPLTNQGAVQYWRPIVCGQESLIRAPFAEMERLVTDMQAGGTVEVDMIKGVARILRAPLDRFGQVLTSTWSWIGGYAVGTDLLTGDSTAYKRAVVVEHA